MPDVGRVTDPSESAGVAPPLVSLKGVWKVFESVPVLRGISFDLKAGEALAAASILSMPARHTAIGI